MKNFALVLAAVPLAFACDSTKVSCGMLIHDEVNGACVCPPGIEVDYERWLCLFPDAAVPIEPFDGGVADSGVDSGTDAGADSGADSGTDAGPDCIPTDEVCEGSVDEDCDDRIDEGCECADGASRDCGSNQGVCETGTQVCESGAWATCEGASTPGVEVCDGALDEDCDGSVDEGCACANGMTRPCPGGIDTGECAAGTQTCTAGAWASCVGSIGPRTEACDGRDNDCDGVIDGPAASAACGTATNATALTCSAGSCLITGCLPGTDDCNDAVSDGCEVDLTLDRDHCGTCGRRCSAGQLCSTSSCTNAPLTTGSQLRAVDCDSCRLGDNSSGGDFVRETLEIAAMADGRSFVLQNYSGLGDGGGIQAHAADLSVLWDIGNDFVPYNGLACSATTCSTSTLDEARDDMLVRIGLTGATPTRTRIEAHTDPLAPLLATPDGRWLHISERFTRTFIAPDVSLVAPAGAVAFMGRRDIAYTTSSSRQLRATRLTGATEWTFSLPVGWTLRDGAAGIAGSSGSETNVYTIATRTVSGRVQSRVSMVDGGTESEWADLMDGTRDFVAEAIAVAPNGNVYIVGTRGNRGVLAVYERDMSFIYLREATGTAYSRFMDITFLPSGEALLLGLRTAGTLTFGGSTLGSGAVPPGSPNDLEADAFILRLRVE